MAPFFPVPPLRLSLSSPSLPLLGGRQYPLKCVGEGVFPAPLLHWAINGRLLHENTKQVQAVKYYLIALSDMPMTQTRGYFCIHCISGWFFLQFNLLIQCNLFPKNSSVYDKFKVYWEATNCEIYKFRSTFNFHVTKNELSFSE